MFHVSGDKLFHASGDNDADRGQRGGGDRGGGRYRPKRHVNGPVEGHRGRDLDTRSGRKPDRTPPGAALPRMPVVYQIAPRPRGERRPTFGLMEPEAAGRLAVELARRAGTEKSTSQPS